MAASRRSRSTGFRILALGPCVAIALLACASGGSGKKPETAAAAAGQEADGAAGRVAAKTDAQPQAEEAAGESSNGQTVSVQDDDSVIVISAPDAPTAQQPATLVEAAAAARAQRAAAGPPVAVFTDENTQRGRPRDQERGGNPAGASAPTDPLEIAGGAARAEEDTWRAALRAARLRWRDTARDVEARQTRVAELRNAFYAADDPAYRDGVIKPDWDAALSGLAGAQDEVEAARDDLERLLDAGRRAGALPGWLREGLELEPQPRERPSEPSTMEPVEPRFVDEERRP